MTYNEHKEKHVTVLAYLATQCHNENRTDAMEQEVVWEMSHLDEQEEAMVV